MAFNPGEAKSIFTSKTFWGTIVAMVAVMFPRMWSKLGVSQVDVVDKIMGGIGGALAIYGRLSASQPATLTGK
jgi:hypothetical protein